MSRFENIEFGGAPRRKAATARVEADTRGAAHFREKGIEAWLAGDFERALRLFSRCLEQDAAFFDGWFGQVRMLLELGEFKEALLWSDKALELFPEHPTLIAAKAVAACRTGETDKALAYSDHAIGKRGAGSYVWLSRAEVLLARGSPTGEHCVRNAVSLYGADSPSVVLEAGRLLRRSKRWKEALSYFRRVADELPDSALFWLEAGRCQAALGMRDAESSLERCLTLRPAWLQADAALSRFRRRGFLKRIRDRIRRLFGREHANQ